MDQKQFPPAMRHRIQDTFDALSGAHARMESLEKLNAEIARVESSGLARLVCAPNYSLDEIRSEERFKHTAGAELNSPVMNSASDLIDSGEASDADVSDDSASAGKGGEDTSSAADTAKSSGNERDLLSRSMSSRSSSSSVASAFSGLTENSTGSIMYDDEDHSSHVVQRMQKTEDDFAFERELNDFQNENLAGARLSKPTIALSRMVVPKGIQSRAIGSSEHKDKAESAETVSFHVLMRRGAKSHARPLSIPRECALATAAQESGEYERAEQLEMKRLVLTSSTLTSSDSSKADTMSAVPVPIVVPDNTSNQPLTFAEREQRKYEQEVQLFTAMFKPKNKY